MTIHYQHATVRYGLSRSQLLQSIGVTVRACAQSVWHFLCIVTTVPGSYLAMYRYAAIVHILLSRLFLV